MLFIVLLKIDRKQAAVSWTDKLRVFAVRGWVFFVSCSREGIGVLGSVVSRMSRLVH